MNTLNKILGVTVLALGVSASVASAAEVTITEVDYGNGKVLQTADVILNYSQAGTFSLDVSENHLTVNAEDSNGTRFSCTMNGVWTKQLEKLDKLTDMAATIQAGERVQFMKVKNVPLVDQVCHIKKVLRF